MFFFFILCAIMSDIPIESGGELTSSTELGIISNRMEEGSGANREETSSLSPSPPSTSTSGDEEEVTTKPDDMRAASSMENPNVRKFKFNK